MTKIQMTILALAFAVLGGCGHTPGSMVGTSAIDVGFQPAALPKPVLTVDE